jgi:Uma2 family endonuclease
VLPRKQFTRKKFNRLYESGLFETWRYELIDGDLIEMTGQNPPHPFAIHLVLAWLARILKPNLIGVHLPVEASAADREHSLPEPDLAVLAARERGFARRHPRGDELLLAVEIANATAGFDLSRKALLYAAAVVPEYWVLDLQRGRLVTHRDPSEAGYRLTRWCAEPDTLALTNRTETVRVGDLLPLE